MKLLLCISTTSKQQLSDAPLTMTLQPSVFLLKDIWMHTPLQLRFMKKTPQTLCKVIRIDEQFNAAEQLTAMLTPPMVSMMSNDDRCFVCGQMGHFGCHCPDAQCYSCNEFGHFAQDYHNKIPPSKTPHHQNRSQSKQQYTHSQRDRSHSTHYDHRHMRYFNKSQSCCCSHCDRSRSSLRRHTLCSSSSHHSGSWHMPPFGQWMPPLPLIP